MSTWLSWDNAPPGVMVERIETVDVDSAIQAGGPRPIDAEPATTHEPARAAQGRHARWGKLRLIWSSVRPG